MRVHRALERLKTQPLAPGIPREKLVREARDSVENPGNIDQGLHPHMCVPAALQSFLAETDPVEMLDLIGELASPQGVAQTASGAKLFRIDDALVDDGTDRNLVERLLQAAIFDGAERAVGVAPGSYSSLHHTSEGSDARGLGTWQTTEMLKQLTDDQSWTQATPSMRTLDKACESEPVPVVLKTGPGRGHQGLLLDVDTENDRVAIRDPEGEYAPAFPGANVNDGVQNMSLDSFEAILAKAYLRESALPPEDRDPSTWMMA